MGWNARSIVGLVNHHNNYVISGLPFLPHLTSLVAEPAIVASLCAGRPINRVGILGSAGTMGKALASSIAQSIAPIRTITIMVHTEDQWRSLLPHILDPLKATAVSSTLRELKITSHLESEDKFSGSSEFSFLDLEWVNGFTSLEMFEFISSSKYHRDRGQNLKQGHDSTETN
ncbi:hypothetical protein BDV93DRAFT_519093 [Ceratobasidium sp. AG-I]|nr:hypothetical protein BDV93DRAFT_519093 [Ceratobasidium sp. AG-I]